MAHKRRKRSQVQKFYCPYCSQRLWRVDGRKHHLFYQGTSEIKKHLNISRKRASFLASKNTTYVDCNSWIEELLCEEHGKIWMRFSKKADGTINAVLAEGKDWLRTSNTINPDFPNPSVSEFSYRMSRRSGSYRDYMTK